MNKSSILRGSSPTQFPGLHNSFVRVSLLYAVNKHQPCDFIIVLDFAMHCRFVSAEPDVSRLQLMPLQDEFVILASDGLWDVISSKEACEIVKVGLSDVHKIVIRR